MAKDIFKQENYFINVTEFLNHLSLLEKLKAVNRNLKGMSYAEESARLVGDNATEKKLVLRTLNFLGNSAGLFEGANHLNDVI